MHHGDGVVSDCLGVEDCEVRGVVRRVVSQRHDPAVILGFCTVTRHEHWLAVPKPWLIGATLHRTRRNIGLDESVLSKAGTDAR
jgi:hypothetical protein